jgi:peptide deformylase
MTELLTVRTFGDPILREVAQPVTTFDDDLRALLDRMRARMDAAGAKGIAGNQVGMLLRVFTWRLDAETDGLCVNPQVIATSEELEAEEEGCLSFPRGFRFLCERPREAQVRYQDAEGVSHERIVAGRLARTFLHEIDHLNGVLFIDHLTAQDQERFAQLASSGALDHIPQPYAETLAPDAHDPSTEP